MNHSIKIRIMFTGDYFLGVDGMLTAAAKRIAVAAETYNPVHLFPFFPFLCCVLVSSRPDNTKNMKDEKENEMPRREEVIHGDK